MPVSFNAVPFETVAAYLDTTDTVTIITRRAGGEEKSTLIWTAVVDGTPYIRSAFGADSWWYKRARARGEAAFVIGDWPAAETTGVRLEHVEDAVEIAGVDGAFSEKYANQPADLKPMLDERSRACTMRVRSA